MKPLRPEHADKVMRVGATGFEIRRVLVEYAYPNHGNLHNPTPKYRWDLLLEGRVVDHDARKSVLVAAAHVPDARLKYLS